MDVALTGLNQSSCIIIIIIIKGEKKKEINILNLSVYFCKEMKPKAIKSVDHSAITLIPATRRGRQKSERTCRCDSRTESNSKLIEMF